MSALDSDFQMIVKKIRASASERQEIIRLLANDVKLKSDIQGYVLKNNGSMDDGVMVFHDSIIAFIKRVFTDQHFILSTSFQQYIFGIAKNIWLTNLKKNNKLPVTQLNEDSKESGYDDDINQGLFAKDKIIILHRILKIMKPKCKDVLLYWAGGYSMQEIAIHLGYPSEGAARKKKCECYKSLIEWLEQHPHYIKELKN